MAKWVFMTDPATGNIGLYDEPVATGDFDDPNSSRNDPLNDPEGNLASVYWHILMDNLEVAFDDVVSVSHGAIGSGTDDLGSGAATNSVYDIDATTVDHDVLTHGLGYEPLAFAAIGDDILTPGYPVQYPGTTNGSARYVCLYVTSTKVFLREFRSRGSAGLAAINLDYRIIVFKRPPARDASGILIDNSDGVMLGEGRFHASRRYLQVVPGGSPLGLALGRTMDGNNGAPRFVSADGTIFDPVPTSVKMGIVATGGEFASDSIVYGDPMTYQGTFAGDGAVLVQVPDGSPGEQSLELTVDGQLIIMDGDRVVASTEGTLINLLPTERVFSGVELSFPQPAMDYCYGWRGKDDRGFNPSPEEPDSHAQNNLAQIFFTAVGEEIEDAQVLMAAPEGADIFFGLVRLNRVTDPTHTWYGRTLDPVLPQNVWIPWIGSGMPEAGLGVTRLIHLAIEGGNLILAAQQSVSDTPMGGVAHEWGDYPASSIFTTAGDNEGGNFVYNAAPGFGVWTSTASPYRKNSNRVIDTDGNPADFTTHQRGSSDPVSTTNPTSYQSDYTADIKGFFGRRS